MRGISQKPSKAIKSFSCLMKSLFNIPICKKGNRRTASVRSVGYSDLFVLSKKDMWDVLKEYPAARVRLEAIAVKRLEKYKKAPLEKGKWKWKSLCDSSLDVARSFCFWFFLIKLLVAPETTLPCLKVFLHGKTHAPKTFWFLCCNQTGSNCCEPDLFLNFAGLEHLYHFKDFFELNWSCFG